MTNDTNTLNGALAELGETMAANLTAKGVTSSASEGLTTLAGKILIIPAGSCYHIEFSEDSYIAVGGSATLEIMLQENYAPKSGATVTVSGSDSSLYTGITNSEGIASITISNVSSEITFTASFSNVSAQCTVTVSNVLFYDDATSDRKADYEWLTVNSFNGTPSTWAYDSTNHCYNLGTGSVNDKVYGLVPKNLSNISNCKITAKVQVNSTGNVQIGCGLHNNTDTTVQIASRLVKTNNTISIIRVNPDTTIANKSQSLSTNTDYIIEFIYDDGDLTFNLYNSSNTLLKSLTGTTTLLGTNNTPMVYFAHQYNQTAKLKEFKVEAL